ncbi:MAG TPA: hypothetical protein VME67_19575 [Mycobacterium sp.]|nr:hypothetical protein [Mycobacterium sp.]HTX96857.1 hypothetical protein [Mycobacterium sp.]
MNSASRPTGLLMCTKKSTATTGYNNQHALDGAHPTSCEVSQCDYWYQRYSGVVYPNYLPLAIEWYENLQTQSEAVLKYYTQYANLPLKPINPHAPPKATVIKPPIASQPGDTPVDKPGDTPKPDPTPKPTPTPTPTPAQIGQLAGGLSQGLEGFSQGMQGVQSAVQGFQGMGQGAGGAIPAGLASDTTKLDQPPAGDPQLADDEKRTTRKRRRSQ